MKTSLKTLLVVGLTCLQYLSGIDAQAATPTTPVRGTVSATTTTVPTPSQPSFVNTPGLQISSVYNGMTIIQDTVLSIMISLSDQRPISSINFSVAKKDGSSNTTISTVSSGATIRSRQLWNVTSEQYPLGEYLLNIIITPNNTVGAGTNPPASSSSAPPEPKPTEAPSTPSVGPAVYYWQMTVKVVQRSSPLPSSSAMSLNVLGGGSSMGYLYSMMVAVGVISLGAMLGL